MKPSLRRSSRSKLARGPRARAFHSSRARKRRREGAAAVEFALVLPFLVILLLGLIDFGHLFFSVNTITNAAREAARRAAVQPSAATAAQEATAAANEYLAPAGLAPGGGGVARNCTINCPTITVTALSAASPDTVRVVITIPGAFRNLTNFSYAVLPGFSNPFSLMVDLSATSEMRWELTP